MTNPPDDQATTDQIFDMSDPLHHNQALAGVLAWYQAMGVDQAVSSVAVDWLAKGQVPPLRLNPQHLRPPQQQPQPRSQSAPARTPPPRAAAAAPPVSPSAPAVTLSDEAAEANARDTARHARTLDELHELLRNFDGCGLKRTAKNLCFYRGAPRARVMIIGEAPGRDEDIEGRPFVGRAGQLLNKMLAAINLSEADTHITNVVYWRPPGNRVPTPQETLICRPFLERQIRLVQPDLIVTVGGAAAKLILDTTQGIMKVRGKWGAIDVPAEPDEDALTLPVMPTLHPAYLLRSPAHKRQAWRDLLTIRARLDGTTE